MNLFTRYLNSAAVFLPPDDAALAQRQREEINITATTHEDKNQNNNSEGGENGEENANENNNEEDEDEDEAASDDEEDEEQKTSDEEASNANEDETEEQKAERLAKEEKARRKQERQQRKWDRLAAEKTAAEKRVRELEAQLNEQPKEGLTEEEVERRAEEKAAKKLEERQAREAQKAFEDNCDALEADAVKAANTTTDQFRVKLGVMNEEIGQPVQTRLVTMLAELDNKNGGEVLNYLTDNIDEVEELYKLSDIRMSQKIIRLSDKLKAEKAPKPKPKSNNPPPIKPINESGRKDIQNLTGKEDMDTFVKVRERQVAERQKARGY